eukprot:CAMPEP_0176165164 /NCGR_PEP_ID=MMETSP0120_2-20121206/84483_1 /TAXON_ID=160619 /ORGANISM="Kryptoperidinium foliaceum, Strain CCMP 1326" /LENGTH=31 /DNA_ID= /DNA_START= /DNA_END= /DNA_ORIENTATION=
MSTAVANKRAQKSTPRGDAGRSVVSISDNAT